MLKVALTGGIATGKSYVVDRLQQRGIPCLDADQLAHGATGPGTEATAAIAERFGPEVIGPDGGVDRAALGPIVFADAAARRDLEAIVHPAVYRAIQAGVRAFELLGNYPCVVVDVPLLFETGHAADFDRVIVTACEEPRQIERLMKRGLSDEAAWQRVRAQLPTADKVAKADFVIRTDGAFAETERQIDDVVAILTKPLPL
jgi:dephospho-CoA kinase